MDAISLIILNCAKTSDINLALVLDLMHEIKCLDNFFLVLSQFYYACQR